MAKFSAASRKHDEASPATNFPLAFGVQLFEVFVSVRGQLMTFYFDQCWTFNRQEESCSLLSNFVSVLEGLQDSVIELSTAASHTEQLYSTVMARG